MSSACNAPACLSASRIEINAVGEAPISLIALTIWRSSAPGLKSTIFLLSSLTVTSAFWIGVVTPLRENGSG